MRKWTPNELRLRKMTDGELLVAALHGTHQLLYEVNGSFQRSYVVLLCSMVIDELTELDRRHQRPELEL